MSYLVNLRRRAVIDCIVRTRRLLTGRVNVYMNREYGEGDTGTLPSICNYIYIYILTLKRVLRCYRLHLDVFC
jgi:hypothetical protein